MKPKFLIPLVLLVCVFYALGAPHPRPYNPPESSAPPHPPDVSPLTVEYSEPLLAPEGTDTLRKPTNDTPAPKPSVASKPPTLADKLLDNWDLEGTGLTREDLKPFFRNAQPQSLVLFTPEGTRKIYPKNPVRDEYQSDKSLFLTATALVNGPTAESQRNPTQSSGFSDRSKKSQSSGQALPENAFEIEFFSPGLRDNGKVLVPVVPSLLGALQGPDYDFGWYNPKDKTAVLDHLARVLSLGHHGELMLRVSQGGALVNEPGPDFFVYQTTFNSGPNYVWHKYARIGVSDRLAPDSFKWFECDPSSGITRGCVGTTPTSRGGDAFDLSDVGVRKAKYIWIKDTGKNMNRTSDWPTEGVSIDALRLIHAYK